MANQEKTAAELYREERKERIAKAAKKNQKKQNKIILSKKSKAAIAVVVVLAIALGIGGFAIGNSGLLLRSKVAFTVGEAEVSLAEYNYYVNSNYQEQYSYSYQFDQYYGAGMGAMYTGYDCSKTPDAQSYSGKIEGIENPTWADYFDYNAKRQIQYAKAAAVYAAEKGIELFACVGKGAQVVYTEGAKEILCSSVEHRSAGRVKASLGLYKTAVDKIVHSV
jgi:hypothetical protein